MTYKQMKKQLESKYNVIVRETGFQKVEIMFLNDQRENASFVVVYDNWYTEDGDKLEKSIGWIVREKANKAKRWRETL